MIYYRYLFDNIFFIGHKNTQVTQDYGCRSGSERNIYGSAILLLTQGLDQTCSGNYYASRRSSGKHPFTLDQVHALSSYLDSSIRKALN